MASQTIAERLLRTKNLAARHILQDEAAVFGAQGEVTEQLEAELACAEAEGLPNQAPRHLIRPYLQRKSQTFGGQDTAGKGILTRAEAKDLPSKECSPVMCLKFDSSEVQCLSGLPVCTRQEPQD
jgi:hypothetical protein